MAEENKFIDEKHPILFINCDEREQPEGTSFYNQQQVDAIYQTLALLLKKGYDFSKFGFSSPYRPQQNLLKEKLRKLKTDPQLKALMKNYS
jgi:superfamily I DNA and/or RNA helicase